MTVPQTSARCPHVDPRWGQCALPEGHALDRLPEDTCTGSLDGPVGSALR